MGWLLFTILLALGLFYASYNIQAGIYLKALCKVETKEQLVYLSFDDGPHPVQTPKVLDVLKKYEAKASFFCIGAHIEGNESLLKRIDDEGHLIGNHSYSHSGFFPLFSRSKMDKDLDRCDELLFQILKKKNSLFRPPFGVTNPIIAQVVKQRKYKVVGWNIRTFDTQTTNTDKVLKKIERQLEPGSIILLHDRLANSDKLLEMILQRLIDKGYKFGKLPESSLHL